MAYQFGSFQTNPESLYQFRRHINHFPFQFLLSVVFCLVFIQNATGQESPTVSIAPPSLAAGDGGHLFEVEGDADASDNVPGGGWTLTRTGDGAGELTVNITVSETGSDFVPAANEGAQTVTFADSETTATYRPIEDDAAKENNGTVTVALAGGDGYEVDGANNSVTVSVRDDDERIEFTLDPLDLSVVEGEQAQLHAVARTTDTDTFTEIGDVARVLRRRGGLIGQMAPLRLAVTTNAVEAGSPDDFGPVSSEFDIAASAFSASGDGYAARVELSPVITVADAEKESPERFLIKLAPAGGLSFAIAGPATRANIPDLMDEGDIVELSGDTFIAAVITLTDPPPLPGEQCAGSEGEVRLMDGSDGKEGRVEICADNDTGDHTPARWGTVCDDYWTDADADVACRVLGYERSEPYAGRFLRSRFGAGQGPVWLDDLLCNGTESSLLDCPLASGSRARDAIGVHNCKSNEIVGVRCMAAGDVVQPYVNGGISITGTGPDGHYEPGNAVRVTLTFNEPVNVDTTGGTPSLGLVLATHDTSVNRTASYSAGSGTTDLVFVYRVAAADGEFDELQVVRHSLAMNGGTIRNAGGVDALLANPYASVSPETNAHAASLRVADATAQEGARLEFRVTLSRASDRRVSVSYRTEDGTATDGEDYTGVNDTLTFSPGETAKTVAVATIDDSLDDDGETFTLRLTSYSGAYLEDDAATGTIHNSDPLPKGWLNRFGRTGAVHIVDMLNARFDEAAGADNRLTLGGRAMDYRSSSLRQRSSPVYGRRGQAFRRQQEPSEPADRPKPAPAKARVDILNDGMSEPASGSSSMGQARQDEPAGQTGTATPLERALWDVLTVDASQFDPRRFLSRSSFNLTLSGSSPASPGRRQEPIETIAAAPESPGRWTVWGRGALTHFGGVDEGVNLDGDVLTGLLGLDYARNRWLAGIALAYHDGNGSYRSTRNAGAGDLDSTLVSVNPYLRYALTDRLSVWGTLGYGTGTLQLQQELRGQGQMGTELNSVPGESAGTGAGLPSGPGAAPRRQVIETDMSLAMGALGLRGVVYASVNTELALKTDALWVRTTSGETRGLQGAGAETGRLRLLLAGRHQRALANDAMLSPSFELGIRYDDGDAETGFGMELGGGLRYADALLGLTVETKARALLAHEDGGYEEWGVGGSLSLDPGRLGRGLALRLDTGWGLAESGAGALWQRQTAAGIAPQHDIAAQGRFTAEMGYGLDVPWTHGILTPYSGMEWAGASRTLRLGWRFTLGGPHAYGVQGQASVYGIQGQALYISLDGERREDGHSPPEHILMLRASLPW